MNNQDKEKFAQLMTMLSTYYDKPIGKPLAMIYFQGLQEYSIQQVEKAISKAIQGLKYIPKIVEIIELISDGPGRLEDRAEAQASEVIWAVKHIGVYQSVTFQDLVTSAVVQQCYGGWIQLCTELLQDEEKWFRKDFVKYYRAYNNQGIAYNGHLIGMIESENFMRGYENYIPVPVLVNDFKELKLLETGIE